MNNYKLILAGSCLLTLFACGGGSGGSNGSPPADGSSPVAPGTVSFGLSDAPVDGLSEVVITIDGIELRGKDDDDCDDDLESDDCAYIDQFGDADINLDDTVTVDLLTLQGSDNQIIVDGIELEAGDYDQLRLSIIDEDTNFSWVLEDGSGTRKELKVPSDELKLGGFTVESGGVQVFVIEFDLRKAMTYNPGPDRYILKPTGVRVVEVDKAASVSGTVDTGLFDSSIPCDSKLDPVDGNVIYVYQGQGLVVDDLADNFNSGDNSAPVDAIAPYTSQTVEADGSYDIGYLPAGDYTLAFSCEAENDLPEKFDGIVIPSPSSELVELTLAEGESRSCDFPVVDGGC